MAPINWKNERRKISEIKPAEYNPRSLDKIFNLAPDRKEQADHAPALRPETTVRPGDIFQLGRHRIMCGDSTNQENVNALCAGSRAQLVFTDPPYNVAYRGGNSRPASDRREGIANDDMDKAAFYEFLAAFITCAMQVNDGAFYICMSSSEMDTLMTAFREAGGHWSNTIVWVKNTFTLGRSDYQHQYEPILYGWKKGQKHHFTDQRHLSNVWEDLREIKTSFKDGYTTIAFQGFKVRIKGEVKDGEVCRGRSKTNIWRYDKPSRRDSHPTMKPVALVCEAIRNSSEREQFVLDTFLGSGTTLMACELENRACLGLELDPVYVQCAIDRWEEFTGKKAVKVTEMDRICIDAIAQHAPEASNA
jgi:DNA modification methylase